VPRFNKGDAVFGYVSLRRNGAYAQYVVAQSSDLAPKPASLDFVHAAGLPIAALTAWQGLFEQANLADGQHVLVHGAAGGVGSMVVQLAKWKRAKVAGTSSAKNLDYLRSMGVDEAIDYGSQKFEEVVRDLDVVYDTIGGPTQDRSLKALRAGGTLVSTVGLTPAALEKKSIRALGFSAHPSGEHLAKIALMVEDHKLTIPVETVLPLREARKAQELSATGHTRGKIVLVPE
jgi:NADPH:quinone reductase-like Zn-dependent oxidoreductase